MVTVTCQYSGVEFQAKTARSKNHPRVAALLEQANKKGVYGDVVSAMSQAKRDGLTGEAVIEAAEAALAGGLKAAAEFNARWRAERRERLAEESARIAAYRADGPTARLDEEEAAARDDATFRPAVTVEPEIYG